MHKKASKKRTHFWCPCTHVRPSNPVRVETGEKGRTEKLHQCGHCGGLVPSGIQEIRG